jgi:hypothetical protein
MTDQKRPVLAPWAIVIAVLLGAMSLGSLAIAAANRIATSSSGFKVSHCDFHTGQGCPPTPAPNSCHQNGPAQDSHCTPGVLNPAVTQSTINKTICKSGWTATIRPPTSYTNPLKLDLLKAYSEGGQSPSGFELDHLISLELGGAPSDERNLWPESHQGSKSSFAKDRLENSLKARVCDHSITLATAQSRIVHWPKYVSSGASGGGSGGGSGGSLDKNCSDFTTQAQAQAWFNQHGGSASNDVAGLDRDHDGIACESLP